MRVIHESFMTCMMENEKKAAVSAFYSAHLLFLSVCVFDSGCVCCLGGSAGLRDYGESDHVIVMVCGDPAY